MVEEGVPSRESADVQPSTHRTLAIDHLAAGLRSHSGTESLLADLLDATASPWIMHASAFPRATMGAELPLWRAGQSSVRSPPRPLPRTKGPEYWFIGVQGGLRSADMEIAQGPSKGLC